MSTFYTYKSYKADSSFIPFATARIRESFSAEGFEINEKVGTYNKTILKVTKGNLAMAAVGLKQSLEISFEASGDQVNVEARATVLKYQVLPSILTCVVIPYIAVPQIIGLVKQSGLDDKAIGIIDTAYAIFTCEQPTFCTHCGEKLIGKPSNCPHCGAQIH